MAVDGSSVDDQPARQLAELEQLIAAIERANDLLGAIQVAGSTIPTCNSCPRRGCRVADVALRGIACAGRLVSLEILPDGLIEIDLIEEMHAAAQIEAEQHRLEAERLRASPAYAATTSTPRDSSASRSVSTSRARSCDRAVSTRTSADVSSISADRYAMPASVSAMRTCSSAGRVDRHSVRARDLHGFVVAEHVRQRDDRRHEHDAEDEQVLPQRIAVHAGDSRRQACLIVSLGSTAPIECRLHLDLDAGRQSRP